ncbi:MAG: ABC transporter ATP-binding protein [Jaaginema sp. PMC 1079.18]|nr:ABC transporter ATP-binding protein [Jaaginema sp. PMC 1080.18]MEC4850813.1 ABC transporter ATP-binding protein [Jaaginema sp. PMC 1079.18]MEC4867855.1 ABC transporter ATP-binding protein [Jaaginema sp. PMC 1078.18]
MSNRRSPRQTILYFNLSRSRLAFAPYAHPMTGLLDVRNLETRFPTRNGIVKAVNGISFQVYPGETVGIVGESGSGKTISMMSLLRLLPSTSKGISSGEVWFESRDLFKLSKSQMRQIRGSSLAVVFQNALSALNPVLRIEKQMVEGMMRHLGLNAITAQKRAIELLDAVGIPDAKNRIRHFPHQFSGGMRQRVAIAMGIACHPQLLIADEPTTALDVTIQAQIVDLIKHLKTEMNMAAIWITHDLALLASLADRIFVMYAGQIVEQAPLRQLYYNPRHPYTIGLLKSLPRLDANQPQRLQAIEGFPPDLIHYPAGCPFAARCPYVIDRCQTEDPILELVGENHTVACWVKPHL